MRIFLSFNLTVARDLLVPMVIVEKVLSFSFSVARYLQDNNCSGENVILFLFFRLISLLLRIYKSMNGVGEELFIFLFFFFS